MYSSEMEEICFTEFLKKLIHKGDFKTDFSLRFSSNSKKGKLYEPKSTRHLIFCNNSKSWHPITLVSSWYPLKNK